MTEPWSCTIVPSHLLDLRRKWHKRTFPEKWSQLRTKRVVSTAYPQMSWPEGQCTDRNRSQVHSVDSTTVFNTVIIVPTLWCVLELFSMLCILYIIFLFNLVLMKRV